MIEKLERNRGDTKARRDLRAARVEESHALTVDELPARIQRTTKGRYVVAGHIAAAALAIDSSFDNTPSTDLAVVVERLEQARALSGVKERAPRPLPEGVEKKAHGDGTFFITKFRFGKEPVSLRAFGRVVQYETAEEAAAAFARFRASPADAQTKMISKVLKCAKCGQGFSTRGKGQRARQLAEKRVEAHEETCTVCPAPTL